jgi:hypothetical protein
VCVFVGTSGQVTLDGRKNDFERKATAQFGVECVDLGLINKLRIGHDNSGLGSAWFLDKVKLRNERSGQEWIFLSGQWYSSSDGDGQVRVVCTCL